MFEGNNMIVIVGKIILALVISFVMLIMLRLVIRMCSWLIRAPMKHGYRVQVRGKCKRVDRKTVYRMGRIETEVIPVFEVKIDGKTIEVRSTVSVVPCIIQEGDELELLVDLENSKYIYSDEGLKEYRKLKKQRDKYWWLLDLFFVFVLWAFISGWLVYFR